MQDVAVHFCSACREYPLAHPYLPFSVDNLGKPTERIYAVRFQDELGFVVTFRETDPFYTINMADPNNPFKAGELAIPGM